MPLNWRIKLPITGVWQKRVLPNKNWRISRYAINSLFTREFDHFFTSHFLHSKRHIAAVDKYRLSQVAKNPKSFSS